MNIQNYLKENPSFYQTVVGYLITKDKILLGLRKRVSLGLGDQLFAGIGGKIEKGETKIQALKREIKEEIGVTLTHPLEMGRITYLFPHKPKWNQIATVYKITRWQGEPEESEEIKPVWFKWSDLPKDNMWPDNLQTIPLVLSGYKFSGTFLYNEDGNIQESKLKSYPSSSPIL